jgi:hypothetical protein
VTDENFICTRCDEPCEESEINEKGECPDCAEQDEDDGPEHCSTCNGSGEGMVDGSRCSRCGGSGVIQHKDPDDFDPPDSDDFSDKDFGPYGYSDE